WPLTWLGAAAPPGQPATGARSPPWWTWRGPLAGNADPDARRVEGPPRPADPRGPGPRARPRPPDHRLPAGAQLGRVRPGHRPGATTARGARHGGLPAGATRLSPGAPRAPAGAGARVRTPPQVGSSPPGRAGG